MSESGRLYFNAADACEFLASLVCVCVCQRRVSVDALNTVVADAFDLRSVRNMSFSVGVASICTATPFFCSRMISDKVTR